MDINTKNTVEIIINESGQKLAIEGLQLVNTIVNNAFFTSNSISEQKSKNLYANNAKRQISLSLKGIYVNTHSHKALQTKAFSTQSFKGKVLVHHAFQLTGEFAISRYEISYDLSNLKVFHIDLTGHGAINHSQV